MKVKLKKCKICLSVFKPLKSTQLVCSTKCALKFVKKAKNKQKNDLKDFEDNIKKERSLKKELHTTKIVVHYFVRKRDKGKPCISCGAPWSDTFQAGHFYKAELYSSLKFNLDNIHGQCQYCNLRLEGNLNAYALNLPERIGTEAFNSLNKKALEYKKQSFKWEIEDLKKIRLNLKLLKNNCTFVL